MCSALIYVHVTLHTCWQVWASFNIKDIQIQALFFPVREMHVPTLPDDSFSLLNLSNAQTGRCKFSQFKKKKEISSQTHVCMIKGYKNFKRN